MSGRFAGSSSLDDRRRRRIAAEETGSNAGGDVTDASRPLPARRPSGRFPLRRVISRAYWKLALVLFGAGCAAAGILTIGFLPGVASGAYGPGLERVSNHHAAGPATVFFASLLLISAQLSWLIRWARSRSLRDFRGRYRVWWWSAAVLAISGFAVLTDVPAALAETVIWATNWPPVLGSFTIYELAPALLALVVLFPGLQRDMRGCRTSRFFLFLAALTMLAAGGATAAGDVFGTFVQRLGMNIAPELAIQGLWLAGAVVLFGAFLFHARHVVYESVEPPELPKRARKEKSVKTMESPEAASKTKTASSERQPKATKTTTASAPAAVPAAKAPAQESPTPRNDVPAQPAAKTPAVAAAPEPSKDDRWAEIGTIEVDGRVIRLDGPEDPMKGLSKRDRRKVRKAIKDHQRAGGEEY